MATSMLIPLKDRIFRSAKKSHCVLSKPDFGTQCRQSYKNWDINTVQKACDAVRSGSSVRRAAEEHNIPKSTLHDYVSGKVTFGAKSGAKPYLSEAEEEELESFLTGMSSVGFSHSIKEVIELVQTVVDQKGLEVTVTASWWKSFKSRHPDLVLRTPETLTNARIAGTSDKMIEKYFDLLEATISEHEITSLPCQIFNLDESGFPLNPKAPKIITKKCSKHPATISSCERSQITVLCCCSAGGTRGCTVNKDNDSTTVRGTRGCTVNKDNDSTTVRGTRGCTVNKDNDSTTVRGTRGCTVNKRVEEGLNCENGKCCHPSARNWVMCATCNNWVHCICAGIPSNKAKMEDFVYVCDFCKV